jgi:2,3,4,5-tetrahydropyridine-2,6-dicarboxylate N-succinyltransferase
MTHSTQLFSQLKNNGITMTKHTFAIGLGIGTKSKQDNWLEVFYAKLFQENNENSAAISDFISIVTTHCAYKGGNKTIELKNIDITKLHQHFVDTKHNASASFCQDIINHQKQENAVICILEHDSPIQDTAEAYLKLQLLSHRKVKPHDINLNNLFSVLPNVAWTNHGAIALDELESRQLEARLQGKKISVESIDKFPKMSDYVVPSGVRIADTSRVRLGAYIGEGTTIMHEGFCNFNAGTEGTSMIEGRISAGVFVKSGSDLGGGCSTMGTLSGGNNTVISIGEECLIGANAGIGISLGDRCTVEAGLYITAGSKIKLLDSSETTKFVKARDLSGLNDLLFRRNSQSGSIEALSNNKVIELNNELHQHN